VPLPLYQNLCQFVKTPASGLTLCKNHWQLRIYLLIVIVPRRQHCWRNYWAEFFRKSWFVEINVLILNEGRPLIQRTSVRHFIVVISVLFVHHFATDDTNASTLMIGDAVIRWQCYQATGFFLTTQHWMAKQPNPPHFCLNHFNNGWKQLVGVESAKETCCGTLPAKVIERQSR
jgi:hypothetical protein